MFWLRRKLCCLATIAMLNEADKCFKVMLVLSYVMRIKIGMHEIYDMVAKENVTNCRYAMCCW